MGSANITALLHLYSPLLIEDNPDVVAVVVAVVVVVVVVYGTTKMIMSYFYRPRSWEIMYLVASVCPSVRLSVCALLAEPFDL